MKIVITNDDGIAAPGLATLARLAAEWGEPVIVAPQDEHSQCGHRITTKVPLDVREESPDRYAVSGTPADCTRLALTHLCPNAAWVLAGINPGGNLGVDLYMSGTVAAAREAALLGRPAIALSHYVRRGEAVDWDLALARLRPVVQMIMDRPHEPGAYWNVNLPHPDHRETTLEIVHCAPDPHGLEVRFERDGDRFTYAGRYQERPRHPGSDVDVCFGGRVSVSRLGR